jgi:lipoprotein Spr
MRRRGEAIVARARGLLGARFRPQGRSVERGLDCIGVVVMATGIDPRRVRRDYGLRSSDPEVVNAEFDACGFLRLAPAAAEPGDLLLVRAGPMQHHIVILTELGYLHADARLRRVVEVPGPVPWPALSAWRCPDDGVVAVRLH